MERHLPEWVDRVTSTNTALLERLAAGERLPTGYILAAREQTAGRGRGAHRWRTQPGRDLCCSLVVQAPGDPQKLPSLALAAALAAAAVLRGHGVEARTKWPNDVLAGTGKIAGILPELAAAGSAVLVVGVGLNVNMSSAEAAAIEPPATSILAETGRTVAVDEVLDVFLDELLPRLGDWERDGFAALRGEWGERCIGLGQTVRIEDATATRRGILTGFGSSGQLLLRGDDGSTDEVWSGSLYLD